MIKFNTAIGQTLAAADPRQRVPSRAGEQDAPDSKRDSVEISDECKKKHIMSTVRASLSADEGVKGRFNR